LASFLPLLRKKTSAKPGYKLNKVLNVKSRRNELNRGRWEREPNGDLCKKTGRTFTLRWQVEGPGMQISKTKRVSEEQWIG
jgi:hypothetical protein